MVDDCETIWGGIDAFKTLLERRGGCGTIENMTAQISHPPLNS